jgi:putative membrane protein
MHISLTLATAIFGLEVPVTQLFTYGASIFVIFFALPSIVSLIRQRGIFLGALLFLLLAGFALAFETFALKTGVPYGKYAYDTVLGNKILGSTPWTIGIAYPILLLGAFWLASKITDGFFRPLLTAIFTVVTTIVLDPAAVKLQLWKWEHAGPFFGVPYTHFAGWFVAGLAGAWLIQAFWGDKSVKRGLGFSGALMVWFWTGVNIGISQWIPAAAGVAISLLMFVIMVWERRADKASKKD